MCPIRPSEPPFPCLPWPYAALGPTANASVATSANFPFMGLPLCRPEGSCPSAAFTMRARMADETYETRDDRFDACVRTIELPAKLFEGSRWAEGPAWFAAGRYLVWSDIPNDRMLRWDEPTGTV